MFTLPTHLMERLDENNQIKINALAQTVISQMHYGWKQDWIQELSSSKEDALLISILEYLTQIHNKHESWLGEHSNENRYIIDASGSIEETLNNCKSIKRLLQ